MSEGFHLRYLQLSVLQSKQVAGISQIKMQIFVQTDRLFVLGHENRDYFISLYSFS
jgi:hypothetical protein